MSQFSIFYANKCRTCLALPISESGNKFKPSEMDLWLPNFHGFVSEYKHIQIHIHIHTYISNPIFQIYISIFDHKVFPLSAFTWSLISLFVCGMHVMEMMMGRTFFSYRRDEKWNEDFFSHYTSTSHSKNGLILQEIGLHESNGELVWDFIMWIFAP